MRKWALAGGSVLVASVLARLTVSRFSLYLEPFEVVEKWHVWQLATWVVAGASLTFIAHAAFVALAIRNDVPVRVWLGATFAAGALTTLLGELVPAIFSCTFTGAGVGATAALIGWAAVLKGPWRVAVTLLALVPMLLDTVVDGLYVLVPFGFAMVVAHVWVRWSRRRSHPEL